MKKTLFVVFCLVIIFCSTVFVLPVSADDVTWRQMAIFDCTEVMGVWGTSANDVYVVGFFNCAETYGVIYHYDGTGWSEMSIPTRSRLMGIWGTSPTDIFAVGYDEPTRYTTILHYDGVSWSVMNTPFAGILRAVWGTSANDVFAVGNDIILHYDGDGWHEMSKPFVNILYDVWGYASNDVYAVGDGNAILHYDGADWSAMLSDVGPPWYEYTGIWGSSPADVFAVGCHSNNILHYDGERWSDISVLSHDYCFWSIWGSSASDVFIGGHNYDTSTSVVLHYDGTNWAEMPGFGSPGNAPMDIWGTASTNVYVVEEGANVWHYAVGPDANNTPVGSNVNVSFPCPDVTFTNVTAEGTTTFTLGQQNAFGPLPAGFRLTGPFVYIATTATYIGPVTIGICYDASIQNPQNLKLFHWGNETWGNETSSWKDVTTRIDIAHNIVYGEVTSLSPFFIGETTPNTPVGGNVTVTLPNSVVTFANVSGEGTTIVTTQQGNPGGGIPEGFRVRGLFVDITTDATYSPPVTVGIPYDPSEPNPQNLKLFHWEGGHWVDVTTWVDTTNHIVYGEVSSLSWFFIGGEWVWVDGAAGVPVFPNIYIGIAAALGAGIVAYLLRRRLLTRS